MANLLCESNINFTSSSWKTIDSTSFLNSETTFNTTTTSYQASPTFTPGAITVEGILLKFCKVITNSGTFSAELYNSTAAASVAGTEVTISVSSLSFQTLSFYNGGWIYLKFGSPVTLLAATNYAVRVKSSVNTTITLNVSTGTNWSRGLVTSTTAAPAANDFLITAAPFTTTSTPAVITCTMNNTATTVFGGIETGAYSKFVLANAASTNYNLKIVAQGKFIVGLNSEVEFGTSSSRLDATSTFTLEMQSSGTAANNLWVRTPAKFTAYGASKTRQAKLAANASAGATSLTTDISTGWKNGDEIIFAQTNRSSTATNEKKALTADASGTALTITALTAAKLGTSPVQCDIGNVTSNIKIIGTSTTSTWNFTMTNQFQLGAHRVDVDNVEFQHLFTNGIFILGNASSYVSITNCGFHNNQSTGCNALYTLSSNAVHNFILSGNSLYKCGITLDSNQAMTLFGSKIVNNNLVIGAGYSITNQYGYLQLNEFKNNIASSNNTGITGIFSGRYNISQSFSGNKAYGCLNSGMAITLADTTFSSTTSYLNLDNDMNLNTYDSTLDGFTSFGPASYNMIITFGVNSYIKNASLQSYSGNTTAYGIRINGHTQDLFIDNSSIGSTVAHTTAAILNAYSIHQLFFRNTIISDSTIINYGNTFLNKFSKIGINRLNGTAASNRTIKPYGVLLNDTTIYDVSPSSQRLTPNNAFYKLWGTSFKTSIASGTTPTISVKIRKSVVGDGAAYNGNQPRLILKSNPSAGSTYNSDIICATATVASSGAWETLSYTLPSAVTDNVGMEFYIDCDGTTGWVNVDTFVSNNNNSMTYYLNGEPVQDIPSAGTTETFYTFIT